MKKFIIKCTTNWCGMDTEYSAIAEKERNLYEIAQEVAYENFESHDGYGIILEELFPDVEEYTDEMFEQAKDEEGEYYSYYIIPFDGDDEDWGNYNLIYDESDPNFDIEVEDEGNEIEGT